MNLNIGEGQSAPEDSLSSELDRGDATARALVEHLKRMGAANMHRVVGGFKVSVEPADLPPPFDSQEEAQRAAGIWPQEAEPATVRVKPSALDEMAAQAASWRDAFAEQLAAPDPELVGQKMEGLEGRIAAASPALGAPYGVDFKNHQWIGIAIDHATKWKTAGGLQNLLMAKHYLDKLIELEGKAS